MTNFTRTITALSEHIDELGHVNNAVWVQWIQEMAVSHWQSLAPPEHQAIHVWVVTRHEIDYRGNVGVGDRVVGETWVLGLPRGARFDRIVRFTGMDGKVKVEAKSTWALLDKASGRLLRVTDEIAAPFLTATPPAE